MQAKQTLCLSDKFKAVTLSLFLTQISVQSSAAALAMFSSIIKDFKQGEIPYQLSLQIFGGYHICGASLIKVQSVQLAVTAAHCVHQRDHLRFDLVAGEADLRNTSGLEQRRQVERIVVHENYSPYTGTSDIALLFVSLSFDLNDNVKPLALPNELEDTLGNITVSGWGFLQSGTDAPNRLLQKKVMPVITHEECNAAWQPYVEITEDMLCSRGPSGQQFPCHGDSGGPAAGTRNSREGEGEVRYLAGVVSFGHRSCGHLDFPVVFTKVSSFVDWINGSVTKLALDEATATEAF